MLKREIKSNPYFQILDWSLYTIVLILSAHFILGLSLQDKSFGVLLTFLIVGATSFIEIIRCKDNICIYRVMHIFNYIFLFLAPLQQYSHSVILWRQNGLSAIYTDTDYLTTNIVIIVAVFFMALGYGMKRNKHKSFDKRPSGLKLTNRSLFAMLILSTVCLLILFITNNVKDDTMIVKTASFNDQIVNILKYIPVSSLLIYLMCYKKGEIKHKGVYLVIMIAEVGTIFFPFWGTIPRFILLGTYMVFYAFLFSDTKHKSIYFFAMFIGFCYMFSDMKFAKSYTFSFDTINFVHVDYDAYQLLMLCVKHINAEGTFWGLNLLSSAMFFIPRSIARWKMLGTGGIVVGAFHSWFKNVSMPYIGELYAAFGWLGVTVFGYLSGALIRLIDNWKNDKSFLKNGVFFIITGMTIYIMRGALLATFSYTMGLVLTFYLINKVCLTLNKTRTKDT